MEHLINLILSSPLYQIIAAIIIIALVFFLIKKLFKLVLIAAVLFTGFLVYVHYTGGDVNEVIDNAKESGTELIDKATEAIK